MATNKPWSTEELKRLEAIKSPADVDRLFPDRTRESVKARRKRLGLGSAAPISRHEPLEARFWSQVKVGKTEACWNWEGTIDKDGHGVITDGGFSKLAHRVSYELHVGHIKDGDCVVHTCASKACVNPEHLETMSKSDSTKHQTQLGLNKGALGSANTFAVLNEDDVAGILSLLKKGLTIRGIAERYNVSYWTIYLIDRGKTWKHVKRG